MTMPKIFALCGLCLMLFGCNSGTSVDDGMLSVYVVQEMVRPPGEQYKFVRGAFSRVVLAIENNSDDVLILRGCSLEGQLPDIVRWHGSRYGSVKYRPIEDVWIYNEMAQQLSEPVFASGAVSPHSSIEVVRWIWLRQETVEVDLAYHRLAPEDAVKQLYFEMVVDGQYHKEQIFKHPAEPSQLRDSSINTNRQIVVFPEPQKFPIDNASLCCRISFQDPPLNIDTVQEAVGDEILESVYWRNQSKWVVRTGRGVWVVDNGVLTRLGNINLLSFGVIESSYKKVDCILPLQGYEEFDPQSPGINEGGCFDPGITKVMQGDVLRLLELARDNGDSVTILPFDADGLGMKIYLLVGVFDEVTRREIANQ